MCYNKEVDSSQALSFSARIVGVALCAVLFFVGSLSAAAQSTAFPDDVIESPDVDKTEVGQHFKNIFGRSPSAGELKYWETRLKDKPRELEFLAAMAHWAEQGESPTIENSKFTLTLSGTGRDVFVGETRRHTVTLSHTNPVKMNGYLDLKVNLRNVKPTPPLPNVQQTYVDGVTRLRHHYHLEPDEELTVDLVMTVPDQPSVTFEAIVHGRGVSKQHVTKVYSRVPETLKRPTYHQRQIALMFARIYDRTPSKHELQEWRKLLQQTLRLNKIEAAMVEAKQAGTTLPTGSVLGITSGINLASLNTLFRTAYKREPSGSEWQYWASRTADKPDYPSFFGALQYHQQNHLTH